MIFIQVHFFVFCSLTLLHGTRDRKPAEPGVCGVPATAEGRAEWAGGQAAHHCQWPEWAQQGGERLTADKGNSHLCTEVRKLLYCCEPLFPCLVFSGVANVAQRGGRDTAVQLTFGGGLLGYQVRDGYVWACKTSQLLLLPVPGDEAESWDCRVNDLGQPWWLPHTLGCIRLLCSGVAEQMLGAQEHPPSRGWVGSGWWPDPRCAPLLLSAVVRKTRSWDLPFPPLGAVPAWAAPQSFVSVPDQAFCPWEAMALPGAGWALHPCLCPLEGSTVCRLSTLPSKMG